MPWETREITAGGRLIQPSDAQKTTDARTLTCFTCRRSFDPTKSAIKGTRVAPSVNCNACLNAGYEQGRWQERFLYDAARGTE